MRRTSTRLSGSSTQSTGTSWMRRPLRSARSSSSVSKNQASSTTSGSEPARDVGADGLEAALRIPHVGAEHRLQDEVVRATDQLPLRRARDPAARRQPAPDGDVGVTGHERSHEWQEGAEVGREVDVHVGDDPRVARQPRAPERQTASLAVEVDGPHTGHPGGEGSGRRPRLVRRGVVDDRDPPRQREALAEVEVEPGDAGLQHVGLVVDRDDDVDDGHRGLGRPRRRLVPDARPRAGGTGGRRREER